MAAAPNYLSASTLTGDGVKNPQGDSLGDLKDLMIDITTGRVAYAVLSFGGMLGMGDKLFAVPWDALKIDGDSKQLILNLPKERLKGAPGFDKDHWPNFADSAFADEVHGYYTG